jgi:hypothetical protein
VVGLVEHQQVVRPAPVGLLVAGVLAAAQFDLPAAGQVAPDALRLIEAADVAQDLPGTVLDGAQVDGLAAGRSLARSFFAVGLAFSGCRAKSSAW